MEVQIHSNSIPLLFYTSKLARITCDSQSRLRSLHLTRSCHLPISICLTISSKCCVSYSLQHNPQTYHCCSFTLSRNSCLKFDRTVLTGYTCVENNFWTHDKGPSVNIFADIMLHKELRSKAHCARLKFVHQNDALTVPLIWNGWNIIQVLCICFKTYNVLKDECYSLACNAWTQDWIEHTAWHSERLLIISISTDISGP